MERDITIWKILQKCVSNKMATTQMCICMLGIMIINYLLPITTVKLVDDGFQNRNIRIIIICCLTYIVLYLLNAVLVIIKENSRLIIYGQIRGYLEFKSIDKLSSVVMSYFDGHNETRAYHTIEEDVEILSSVAGPESFDAVASFFTLIGGAVALCRIDIKLIIPVIIVSPLTIIVSELLIKKNIGLINKTKKLGEDYSIKFGDYINGMLDLRMSSYIANYKTELKESVYQKLKAEKQSTLFFSVNSSVQILTSEILLVALYFLSGILLINNEISIGGVFAFQTYAFIVTNSIAVLASLVFAVSSITPTINRFNGFLSYMEEVDGDYLIENENNEIVLENVSFSFDNLSETTSRVLEKVNVCISPNSKNVILGDNGSGKSTLIKLILKIYEPTRGMISFGKFDIENYKLLDYRSRFSLVSRESFVFNTTIVKNICLCIPEDLERLNEILKKVNLLDFTNKYGIDYRVGYNGSKLSSGQRQKLLLARMLYQNRPVVILDEAMTYLDSETIDILTSIFINDFKEKTILYVSHNGELIENFENKIILGKVKDDKGSGNR